MNSYEAKKAARINRLRTRAANAASAAESAYSTASKMAACIPFGQPILVGHHSEKRDRNFRAKIENNQRKSWELSEKAKHYAQQAATAENNNAISSDDPEAVVKLREKIAAAEKNQATMKAANKIIKKKGATLESVTAGLAPLGIPANIAAKLMLPDFCGRIGFADYQLTNNNANINRMKKRLAELETKSADEETEIVVNGVRIVENVEANRCQLFFDGKPSEDVRGYLKSNGFRWSPYNGCWQRQRSNQATYHAQRAAERG